MKNTTSAAKIAQATKLFQDAICAEQRAALRVSTYLNNLIALRDADEITQHELNIITQQAHQMTVNIAENYREGVMV